MKSIALIVILTVCLHLSGYCQLEKTVTQAGVSALPVVDVLKLFPENKIYGFALSGNLGYLILKNISVGIQPYYSQVSNAYPSPLFGKETQDLKLYGLNTYLRYYFINKEKYLIYSLASIGFGNSDQRTSHLSTLGIAQKSHADKSVLISMLGLGIDYFILKNLALELNISYINLQFFTKDINDTGFQTVVPTFGIQYYWK